MLTANRVHDSNVSKYYLAKFMLIGLRNQRYSTYPVLLEETSQKSYRPQNNK